MADTLGRLIHEMRDAADDMNAEDFDASVAVKLWADRLAELQAQQPDPIRELRAYKRGLEDAQQPGAQAVAELPDDATEFQAPAEGFTCFHCGTHFASTPKGIRAAREHFGERPSAPPDCVVVPKALPFAVLGDAAIAGVFETGNPKHGWDYLLSKVGRPCTHPQPPSIPEPSEEDVEAAAASIWDVSPHDMMASAGHPVDWTSQPESIKRDYRKKARAALTTYTARLRERIGGGV